MPNNGHIKIHHPYTGETVNTGSFAAFGMLNRNNLRNVKGFLTADSGTHIQGTRLTSADPGCWIIYFRSVADGHYTLKVQDADDLSADPEFDSASLLVLSTWGIITYPAPNTNVCPSFAAYGTTLAATGAPNGTIGATAGTACQNGQNWVLQFLNVASGPNQTLSVTVAGTPSESQTNSGIGVPRANCPLPS